MRRRSAQHELEGGEDPREAQEAPSIADWKTDRPDAEERAKPTAHFVETSTLQTSPVSNHLRKLKHGKTKGNAFSHLPEILAQLDNSKCSM